MADNNKNPASSNNDENGYKKHVNPDHNNQSQNSNSRLGEDEENQQETSSNLTGEDQEQVTSEDDNKTPQAADAAANTSVTKLAGNRRDASEVSSRANEATDRNDSGSGGISAGGAKSTSSL